MYPYLAMILAAMPRPDVGVDAGMLASRWTMDSPLLLSLSTAEEDEEDDSVREGGGAMAAPAAEAEEEELEE